MRRVSVVALTALLLAGCGQGGNATVSPTVSSLAGAPSRPVVRPVTAPPMSRPDPKLTPGTVLTTKITDICTPGWATKHRRSLTAGQKRTVLARYKLPQATRVAEWDHLVSLQLGGGNGPGNIWPDTDKAAQARKDRLENRLHDDVCDGRTTLVVAQARIKQYWLHW